MIKKILYFFTMFSFMYLNTTSLLFAQSTNSIDVKNTVNKGSFMTYGLDNNTGWQFIMGPVGLPNEGLKLIQVNKNSTLGIVCLKDDGSQRLGFTVNDAYFKKNTVTNFNVTIAQNTKTLTMVVTESNETENTTTWQANGNVVTAILQAIGKIPPLEAATITFNNEKNNYVFTIPKPNNLTNISFSVCNQWYKDYLNNENPIGNNTVQGSGNVIQTNNGLILPLTK